MSRSYLLLVFFVVIKTLWNYEGFGISDHIEQLPQIYRSIDPDFLVRDFFVNAAAPSVARFCYNQLFAFWGSEAVLPLLFLMVLILVNLAMAWLSFRWARQLFESKWAGLAAVALAMTVPTFELGWDSIIGFNILVPAALAMPFVLAAIYAAAQRKPTWALSLTAIAALLHPLLGIEIGGLLLVAMGAAAIEWRQLAVPAALWLFYTAAMMLPQFGQGEAVDSATYIHAIAHFRHPHHYLPSTFSGWQYLFAAGWLGVASFVAVGWQRGQSDRYPIRFWTAFAGLVLIACLAGYVFVEILPLRLAVIAQTFRLLYVLKWIALLFIAGYVAKVWEREGWGAGASLLLAALQPLALAWTWLGRRARLPWPASLAGTLLLLYFFRPPILAPLFALVLIILKLPKHRWIVALALFLMGIVGSWMLRDRLLPALDKRREALHLDVQPVLDTAAQEMAQHIRQQIAEDALLLTPPQFGQYRLLARRALVVDIKSFPFADAAVLEWYSRIRACYEYPAPITHLSDVALIETMNDNYQKINDIRLDSLQQRYGFDYAVLYQTTATDWTVLHQNSQYKLVQK